MCVCVCVCVCVCSDECMCACYITGLQRPVKLYTTPQSVYVYDVTVVSSLFSNGSAAVSYLVDIFTTSTGSIELSISLEERQGGSVVDISLILPNYQTQTGGHLVTASGQLIVKTPRLWWPWTMSPDDPGYLYTMKVVCYNIILC